MHASLIGWVIIYIYSSSLAKGRRGRLFQKTQWKGRTYSRGGAYWKEGAYSNHYGISVLIPSNYRNTCCGRLGELDISSGLSPASIPTAISHSRKLNVHSFLWPFLFSVYQGLFYTIPRYTETSRGIPRHPVVYC